MFYVFKIKDAFLKKGSNVLKMPACAFCLLQNDWDLS